MNYFLTTTIPGEYISKRTNMHDADNVIVIISVVVNLLHGP